MKQIEVQIMGMSYLLGCPEGGESGLRDAVGRVDRAMCQIRDGGKIKARDRIAVLAALNLAFDAANAAASKAPDAVPATQWAPTAPATPTAGEAATAPEPTPALPLGDTDQQRLLALVAQMDAVLAADGQLF